MALVVSTTGCLGTLVDSRAPQGTTQGTIQVHILAAPRQVDANVCKHGFKSVFTHVPLWGIAVGILTFGIVVPKSVQYTCVAAP
jgi:hypothetical protein